jgi:hypothetical protein
VEILDVQDAVNGAFAELPIPDPQTVIWTDDSDRDSSVDEFHNVLAGKSWQSLPPGFASKWWAWFGNLTPEAYRYYVPALLTEALRGFASEDNPVYEVVSALHPSFRSIYYEGDDLHFRMQQSDFNERQYLAACEFLGLVFDRNVARSRHNAAQAIRYGWNLYDTPALQAVNAYYDRLRSYSYPEPDAPEKAALCREIRSAFEATRYPGDDDLSGSEQGEESAEMALELRGVKWQSAHPELLARCYSALSFLTDAGFRYFLPAYMLDDLLNAESNSNATFQLTHGLYDEAIDREDMAALISFVESNAAAIAAVESAGVSHQSALENIKRFEEQRPPFDLREYSVKRFMAFDMRERTAIIHYLEFQAQDAFEALKIDQALDSYWRPSLRSRLPG